MSGLTTVQANCLAFIKRYQAEHAGASPAYTDIMDELGLASKSGVHRMVYGLIRRGRLRSLPGGWRTLEVIDDTRVDFMDLQRLSEPDFAYVCLKVDEELARRRKAGFNASIRSAA
ncbi:hypothetical protein ASG17_07690 [Brevundimonas sp. Leaf363]|uniref:LexA family protein n=1 Tax=Brevundimonas sp. Leaf363 TaxID=1736353 RepID=UPI000700B7D3|nr:hypothetical protein [Brevundimonas sp. Leaf363]KQS55924.1 hypothetical protein ASG17_07690 [Brevundimonas sp. Leaf363]